MMKRVPIEQMTKKEISEWADLTDSKANAAVMFAESKAAVLNAVEALEKCKLESRILEDRLDDMIRKLNNYEYQIRIKYGPKNEPPDAPDTWLKDAPEIKTVQL